MERPVLNRGDTSGRRRWRIPRAPGCAVVLRVYCDSRASARPARPASGDGRTGVDHGSGRVRGRARSRGGDRIVRVGRHDQAAGVSAEGRPRTRAREELALESSGRPRSSTPQAGRGRISHRRGRDGPTEARNGKATRRAQQRPERLSFARPYARDRRGEQASPAASPTRCRSAWRSCAGGSEAVCARPGERSTLEAASPGGIQWCRWRWHESAREAAALVARNQPGSRGRRPLPIVRRIAP